MRFAVGRLLRRAEYLRVASARQSFAQPGVVVQIRRNDSAPDEVRVGFTASRKVGKAVIRNRAKRRLKALAAEIMPRHAKKGFDYVLIARAGTPERPYQKLASDLERAMKRLGVWRDGPEDRPEA